MLLFNFAVSGECFFHRMSDRNKNSFDSYIRSRDFRERSRDDAPLRTILNDEKTAMIWRMCHP